MASIDTGTGKKYRLKAPMVDMTPLVDLGFLLISFFIFTTSISQPSGLKLVTPIPDKNNPILVRCSKTVSLFVGSGGNVGWSECTDGVEQKPVYSSIYESKKIRQELLRKRNDMDMIYGDPGELFVIVRPDSSASYQNVIDVLDELEICQVSRYTLLDQ